MIYSFRCSDTRAVYDGQQVRAFPPSIQKTARRKLRQIAAAASINDLRVPPGNRLEKLRGDRAGQHSVRINGQYRVCFVWTAGNAHHVEIVDYH